MINSSLCITFHFPIKDITKILLDRVENLTSLDVQESYLIYLGLVLIYNTW